MPYVILKGTAAAQYYPHPEYRAMGDIDIMTRHEYFDNACQQLTDDGYKYLSDHQREIGFEKNGILVELHRSFASFSDPEMAETFDDLILDQINDRHLLPDDINGLVLIEHIYKHLRGGLGLRQIIDWMMFVDKCLPDEKWSEFEKLLQRYDLVPLAIIVTRMCEMYLGLPVHQWCEGANEKVCKQLMDYILGNGNFGNKRTTESDNVTSVVCYALASKKVFRMLQQQGMHNWKAAQKYPVLCSVAWIYQIGRYVRRGVFRKNAFHKLKEEYSNARERIDLFEALGVNKLIDGPSIYKDGKYVRHEDAQ